MRNYIKKLIDIALIEMTKIMMIFSLTIILSGLLYYQLSYTHLFLAIVMTYSLIKVMTYNLKYFFYSSVTIIGLIIGAIIVNWTTEYLSQIVIKIDQYIYVYRTALTKGYLIPEEYQMVVGIIIGFIICCVVRMIQGSKHAFMSYIFMGLTIILIAFFVRGFYNQSAYYVFIGAVIVYYYYEFYLGKIKAKHIARFYPLAIHAVLFAIVLVFISGYSYRKSPRPLQFVNEIGKTIDKYIINGRSGSGRGGSGTGAVIDDEEPVIVTYENTEALKAEVELTNHAILNVYIDNPTYLRGGVCNIFDGKEWSYDNPSIYEVDDFEEQLYGLQWLSEDVDSLSDRSQDTLLETYYRKYEVNVSYRNIATDILFLPTNVTSVLDPYGDEAMDSFSYNEGGIASFDSDLIEGFNYTFTYHKPKYDEPILEEVLVKSHKGFYKNIPSLLHKNDLIRKADKVREHYLQIPDTTTERTFELAKDITQSSQSDYERAKAIELYLKSTCNYTYTTELPDNGDPIDYFLFETKEGFCTYNATAMVLMLRMNDIPARFVKGFVAKGSQVDEEEVMPDNEMMYMTETKTNLNVITGWDSHAWVEAYLEGFGWIAFEPTSGFEIRTEAERLPTPVVELPDGAEVNEVYDQEALAAARKRIPAYVLAIALSIFIIGIIILVLVIRWKNNEHKWEASQNRFKYLMLFHKCLLMLKLIGYAKGSHLTMREYAKAIAGDVDTDDYQLMTYVTQYEISCYSSKSVPDIWIEDVKAYYGYLKQLARQKTNYWHVQSALFIYHIK
ncbi:transglutaminase domain-containing protein [Vallitalea pronyensis]|uniref:Transglutaminase domain-containing protein n=1 Tax=Vallitalea pronyensis TaxID=1348613 RepID=A0A8J8MM87_9FIRM|nr:transglutaminase-like domain-containing protein [Vallitalea pronyensis]QUI24270.1 transglutaminase domain-containing protein [Vallitalea pronyensis]